MSYKLTILSNNPITFFTLHLVICNCRRAIKLEEWPPLRPFSNRCRKRSISYVSKANSWPQRVLKNDLVIVTLVFYTSCITRASREIPWWEFDCLVALKNLEISSFLYYPFKGRPSFKICIVLFLLHYSIFIFTELEWRISEGAFLCESEGAL